MTSKYDRLGDHLASIGSDEITLTFAEVETIVGPLPGDARRFVGWWGGLRQPSYQNAYVVHWRHRGYISDRPDFAAETVTFRRTGVQTPVIRETFAYQGDETNRGNQ